MEIAGVDPASPATGDTLSIHLKGSAADGKPVRFQYRSGSEEDWKPVVKDVITFPKLIGPELRVELRALDARGRASPVLVRTWTIRPLVPLNLVGEPIRLAWKLQPGDKFYQELRVVQKPSFNIQGLPFTSSLQYSVLSSFTVDKADADIIVVEQKIESAKLLEADTLTQGLLAPAVVKMPGTTFTIHLNRHMEVTKFAGGAAKVQMAMPNLLGGQGLQLASLLDQDGWKEMAQATFFQPNRTLKAGAKWVRPMTHNWGPLGSWTGEVHYVYAGSKKSLHTIDYGLKLVYRPPQAGGGLPIPISGANFQAQEAGASSTSMRSREK